ncbi:MAG: thioredoxin family protein [Clostridiales bacterium]|nr:thioredoxin family protein [Clostridiales bacterium]
MAIIKLSPFKIKHKQKNYPVLPDAVGGARIKICATGCSHCSAMRANVIDAVKKMELPEGSLECVSDFAAIAKLGVMSTPSLIVDGKLVSAGKVMKTEEIISLVKSVIEETDKEKNDQTGGKEL